MCAVHELHKRTHTANCSTPEACTQGSNEIMAACGDAYMHVRTAYCYHSAPVPAELGTMKHTVCVHNNPPNPTHLNPTSTAPTTTTTIIMDHSLNCALLQSVTASSSSSTWRVVSNAMVINNNKGSHSQLISPAGFVSWVVATAVQWLS